MKNTMKKNMMMRGAFGVPTGIAIGYLITIVISAIWGNGYYAPCVPDLAERMGSEINAVVLQTLLCGLIGLVCGAGSVIWDIEEWSIARQTGTYFLIVFAAMLPVGYALQWMEHSLAGVIQYCSIFILIFAAVWIWQYFTVLQKIKAINEKLK